MTKPHWDKKWGKHVICPITQSRLRPGKNKKGIPYAITLPCKHRFYRSALFTWVKHSWSNDKIPSCPLCRKRIYLIDLSSGKS